VPFTRVDTTPSAPDRIIAGAWGLPKEGKTTFALSFPAPIYLFNLDQGYREIVAKAAPGKEIYVSDYLLPEEFDLGTYVPLAKRFRKEWAEAVAQAGERHGTVVLDTASQAWTLIGTTERESAEEQRRQRNPKAKEMRTDWGPANLMMGSMLRRPFQVPGCNAVYLQRAKEVYSGGGEATGVYQMHGFSETAGIVQILLNIFSREKRVLGRIDVCRFDKSWEGNEISDPTYAKLYELVSPDTE
jgi:hypothetical protein